MNKITEKFKISSAAVKITSAVLMILGIITVIMFIPAVTVRVINTGTYFGILAGVVFFLTGMFMPLCINSEKKAVKIIYRVFLSILSLLAVYAIILSSFMISRMNDYPEKGSDRVVIVLGCQVKKSGPSLMLRNRLDAAYEYLSENPDTYCIVSGGKGDDEHISEAQAMYDYLTEKGIDGSRITKEDKSESTMENLLFSKEILERNGNSLDVILVTDGFHQLRAGMMASDCGYNVKSISSNTPPYLVPAYWAREWLALSFMFVFGNH